MSSRPIIKQDKMYQLLRLGKIEEFNRLKQEGESVDFANCDFRGLDLKGIDASGLDFSNSYFRQSDLRGVDFRDANLEGASINGAIISGAYFPVQLSPREIELSLTHGTRMRYDV